MTQQDTFDYNADEDTQSQTENLQIEGDPEYTGNETRANLEPKNLNEQKSQKVNETELQFNKRPHSTKVGNVKRNKTDKLVELFHKNSEERQRLLLKSFEKKTEEHPIDVFFRSMATSVKRMSEERQIRVKMQICQIVGQHELEEVTSRSASTSTHYEQVSSRSTSPFSSYPSSVPTTSDNELHFVMNTSGHDFI